MIFQVKVKFQGDTYVKLPYELNIEPYKITIKCNDKKIVNEIIVQRKIIDYENYMPKFETLEPHKHSLKISEGPYFDEILNLLQTIESLGSFWFRVEKIHWDSPERKWIPENDEEKEKIKITNINFKKEYQKKLIEMHPSVLSQIIELRDDYKHMIIPMAFYREGCNDFKSFRYVNAFMNFYFYLEDLYGNGKTKNYHVKHEFIKSKQIKYAIDKTINNFSERHLSNLKEFLKLENCELEHEGIIELIIKVRGNLHHFSQKSTKKKGHPLNQRDFETMAYLLMSICIHTFTILATGKSPK